MSPEVLDSIECYVGCVAGASPREDYLSMMREAGFADVQVLNESAYTVGLEALPVSDAARTSFDAVVSLKVRARKI